MSRRGYTGWTLEVSGKPAHSSQIFREDIGYGAIYETARILNSFRTELSSQPNLTFNPGLIVGGTEAQIDTKSARGSAYGKGNVIAKTTLVSGDLRTLSPQQLDNAEQAMSKIVGQHLPHTTAKITFERSYPPMAPSKGNYRLLEMYSGASLDLGFGPVKAVDPRRAGAADISFTAQYVDMAIDGLGLMGHSGHTDDETADITTLTQQTKRSAILMMRLLEQHK
ncbi:MAG: glutamate carboxypeptidase [Alteromonadaceae bacterium]